MLQTAKNGQVKGGIIIPIYGGKFYPLYSNTYKVLQRTRVTLVCITRYASIYFQSAGVFACMPSRKGGDTMTDYYFDVEKKEYDAETLTRIFKPEDLRVLFGLGVICQATGLSADIMLASLVWAGRYDKADISF